MALFSLSPSIDVIEKNLSFNSKNLPSAKTAMVLRSNTGPAFQRVAITSEAELERVFGKPTKYNYKDWYDAWNFLQYSSSLYITRPIDQTKATTNAAIALAGGDGDNAAPVALTTYEGTKQADIYNGNIAEVTIPSLATDSHTRSICEIAEATGDFTLTSLTKMINGKAVTQKGTTGTDSATIQVGGVDTFLLGGLTGAHTVNLLSDASLGGWTKAGTLTLETGKGASFVVGETITGDTSGAVGTIDAINSDVLTLSGIVGAFIGDTDATGSTSGAVVDALIVTTTVELTSFLTTTDILTGTVDDARLTVYNKNTTATQDIGIAVCSNAASWIENVSTDIANKFSTYFDYKPDFAGGQFAVVVFKKNADATFTLLESAVLSYNEGGRDIYNKNIFAEEWGINTSKYVYLKVSTSSSSDVNTGGSTLPLLHAVDTSSIYPLTAEVYDPNGYVQADVTEAYTLYDNPEEFDVNILLSHELDIDQASTVSIGRKDCIAIVAPFDSSELVGKSNTEATAYMATKFGVVDADTPVFSAYGTYVSVYGNMKYQYDKYNDTNRWVSVQGDVAGLIAENDRLNDPWWAVAGVQRGVMRNVIKLAFSPNKANRDTLYENAINPIISIAGEGQGVVYGQKTSIATASAFDRLNVRRLMITIEKAVATALRPSMFEFNDETTRDQILGRINPYLAQVQARRGLYEFLVICDKSNNDSTVIDANGLVVDISVKPTKVAEFITVNMVVTSSGANFQELAV